MSLAIASVALMAAGAGSSAVGSYYGAKSQKSNLQFQADIAEVNARIADLGARSEMLRGEREVQSSRLKTAQLKSSQRASLAANGVDLGEGSAVNILSTTDLMGELDADTIAANAVRSAWGYKTQASNARSEAIVGRGTAAGINPAGSAVTSLLGGSGQVASSWYSMNKAGAFK